MPTCEEIRAAAATSEQPLTPVFRGGVNEEDFADQPSSPTDTTNTSSNTHNHKQDHVQHHASLEQQEQEQSQEQAHLQQEQEHAHVQGLHIQTLDESHMHHAHDQAQNYDHALDQAQMETAEHSHHDTHFQAQFQSQNASKSLYYISPEQGRSNEGNAYKALEFVSREDQELVMYPIVPDASVAVHDTHGSVVRRGEGEGHVILQGQDVGRVIQQKVGRVIQQKVGRVIQQKVGRVIHQGQEVSHVIQQGQEVGEAISQGGSVGREETIVMQHPESMGQVVHFRTLQEHDGGDVYATQVICPDEGEGTAAGVPVYSMQDGNLHLVPSHTVIETHTDTQAAASSESLNLSVMHGKFQ
jgi:hypothetical protein